MKTIFKVSQGRVVCAVALGIGPSFCVAAVADPSATERPPIPWSDLGTKASADYKGDGLVVVPTAEGARLHCAFQRLEGDATHEGLWLTSTATNRVKDRFGVVAADLRRLTSNPAIQSESPHVGCYRKLPSTGTVAIDGQTIRFTRPELVEEYSVSMDGVRQDFVLLERPEGTGELALGLAVSGATIERALGGAQLVLEHSGRKIAYSRLRVTDATGRELTARMEVFNSNSESSKQQAGIAVIVDDADAVYPVRIDPTFSDANWISMGGIPGANGVVFAAAVDDSGNLYIGGQFTIVGSVFATNIAKWNGSNWSSLGSGIGGDRFRVYALAVSGSDLYVGGAFTTAGGIAATNIAKWDGSSWSALGSGVNIVGGYANVSALAVSGSNVYAGGRFTTAGGIAATNIAKWNGSAWSALSSGIDGEVYALALSGSNVYAGGSFYTAGGIPVYSVAKWNGSAWSALGSDILPGQVWALAASGSDLYAGGRFETVGGLTVNHIAKWNGNAWSALGSGMNGWVYALAVSGSGLYAAGEFTWAGIPAKNIAIWDGNAWSALGSGLDARVYAVVAAGGNVYAGGFTSGGGFPPNHIAKWNGSSWGALGSGMDGDVSALAMSGSDLYVGGWFTNAGGIPANHIAKWDGSSWSPLGTGVSLDYGYGGVYALAMSGSDLYVGGWFTNAGGIAATNIAKWDGSGWSALGTGVSRPDGYGGVYALAMSGSDLYVGGGFTTAGGIAATNIAKWDGSSWSALGSGIDGGVSTLAVSGSDLYVGGWFTNAGGFPANHIAKWDGSSWSALGSGIGAPSEDPYYGGRVLALAVSGSNIYAGGYFTTSGGSSATNIAKWNGSAWSALGSGIGAPPGEPYYGGSVSALAVSRTDLYVGGWFTNAGGIPANFIAKWDGSNWSPLGSGVGANVNALAVSGSDMYAGGAFTTAGGKVSAYVAKANLYPLVLAIEPDGSGGYFIRFTGSPGGTYRLQRAPTVRGPWTTSAPQTAPGSGLVEFWDLFPPPGQGFYRTVQP